MFLFRKMNRVCCNLRQSEFGKATRNNYKFTTILKFYPLPDIIFHHIIFVFYYVLQRSLKISRDYRRVR